jgi:hypothetical protein
MSEFVKLRVALLKDVETKKGMLKAGTEFALACRKSHIIDFHLFEGKCQVLIGQNTFNDVYELISPSFDELFDQLNGL